MLIISILLFALAAMLGFYLLTFVLTDRPTPKGIAFIHGPLAAIALIILIMYALTHHPAPILSICVFVVAALGGLTLIYRDLTGKTLPKWLALGHGMLALIGFILVVVYAFIQ